MSQLSSAGSGADLVGTRFLISQHKTIEVDVNEYANTVADFVLRSAQLTKSTDVSKGSVSIEAQYAGVVAASHHRGVRLAVAESMFLFRLDCSESEAWLTERQAVLEDPDTGDTMVGTLRHLARLDKLRVELDGYTGVSLLQEQLKVIAADWEKVLRGSPHGGNQAALFAAPQPQAETSDTPSLKAGYPYTARTPQELTVKKGEPLILVNAKNDDWWKVENADGKIGYVPANYVKKVKPKKVNKAPQTVTPTVNPAGAVNDPADAAAAEKDRADADRLTASLVDQLQRLYRLLEDRKAALNLAQKQHDFRHQTDELGWWLDERLAEVRAAETGHDHEGSIRLNHKFADFRSEIASKETQLQRLRLLAAEIGEDDKAGDMDRVDALWDDLLTVVSAHAADLNDTIEIQAAQEAVAETISHMAEILGVLHDGGLGKDAATVSALSRKHDLVIREVDTIAARVNQHHAAISALLAQHPNRKGNLEPTMDVATARLEELKAATATRTAALAQEAALYAFERESRDFLQWVSQMSNSVNALDNGATLHLCDEAIKALRVLSNEMAARADTVPALESTSAQLDIDNSGVSKRTKAHIVVTVDSSKSAWEGLKALIESRMGDLQRHHEILEANQMLQSESTWIAAKSQLVRESRAVLDRYDDVDALLTDYRRLESSVEAQGTAMKALSAAVDVVVKHGAVEGERVQSAHTTLMAARDDLVGLLDKRSQELQAAKSAQSYLHETDEVIDFLEATEEWAVNLDVESAVEVYRASQHMSKLDKEYPEVVKRAHDFVCQNETMKASVHGKLEDAIAAAGVRMQNLVQSTEAGIAVKRQRIVEVRSLIEFDRSIDSLSERSAFAEHALESTDCGSDVGTASALVDRYTALRDAATARDTSAAGLLQQASSFVTAGHFRAEAMTATASKVHARHEEVKTALGERVEYLRDFLSYFQYLRDAADLQAVIDECASLAGSEEMSDTLLDAQTQLRLHATLEEECATAHGQCMALATQASALSARSHAKANEIGERQKELDSAAALLLDTAAKRREELQFQERMQLFGVRADGLFDDLSQKDAAVCNSDCGEDGFAVEGLLQELELLQLSIATLSKEVSNFLEEAAAISYIAKTTVHPMIQAKSSTVKGLLSNVETHVSQRCDTLDSFAKFFKFKKDANAMVLWFEERLAVTSSVALGSDIDQSTASKKMLDNLHDEMLSYAKQFELLSQNGAAVAAQNSVHIQNVEALLGEVDQAREATQSAIDRRKVEVDDTLFRHAFDNHVDVAYSRIRETTARLGTALNVVDLESAASEGRKYDMTSLNLATTEQHVNGLGALIQKAPKTTSDIIDIVALTERVESVKHEWQAMVRTAEERQAELAFLLDWHKLKAKASEFILWSQDTISLMNAEALASDVEGAETMLANHVTHKNNIDTFLHTTSDIADMRASLVAQHSPSLCASQPHGEIIAEVSALKDKVLSVWGSRRGHLDANSKHVLYEHKTALAVSRLSALSAKLKAQVTASDNRGLELLEKTHREDVQAVAVTNELADDLESSITPFSHEALADSNAMDALLSQLDVTRAALCAALEARQRALRDLSTFLDFSRDCRELQIFISAASETATRTEYRDLTLAAHAAEVQDALTKDMKSQSKIFESVLSKSSKLVADNLNAKQITSLVDNVQNAWKALVADAEQRGKNIAEAMAYIEWHDQVERICLSLRQKRVSVEGSKIGDNFGECESLWQLFSSFKAMIVADVARAQMSKSASEKLVHTAPSFRGQIEEAITVLESDMLDVETLTETHTQRLGLAKSTHSFLDDCADLDTRLSALVKRLTINDIGTTVHGARKLLTDVAAFEHDFTALQPAVKSAIDHGSELMQRPLQNLNNQITERCESLRSQRDSIAFALEKRRKDLKYAIELFDYEDKCRDFEAWDSGLLKAICAEKPVVSVEDAAAVMKRHQARFREINARKEAYDRLIEDGSKLVAKQHPSTPRIASASDRILKTRRELLDVCASKDAELNQEHGVQVYLRDADHHEQVIIELTKTIQGAQFGDSLDGTAAFAKRHDDTEKSIAALSEKSAQLEGTAKSLVSSASIDTSAVESRRACIVDVTKALEEAGQHRRAGLAAAKEYHSFFRDLLEMSNWIVEKRASAAEELYLDTANLLRNLRRHNAFHTEVIGNSNRVEAIERESQRLVSAGQLASRFPPQKLQSGIQSLREDWAALLAESSKRGTKLNDVIAEHSFYQKAEDIMAWTSAADLTLASEELGDDLPNAKQLLKQHDALCADLAAHVATVAELEDAAKAIALAGNFRANEVSERLSTVTSKFNALQPAADSRSAKLSASVELQQLLRAAELEKVWISEKHAAASVDDVSGDLPVVALALKTHRTLALDVSGRKARLEALFDCAASLIGKDHYASATIKAVKEELATKWANLLAATERRGHLLDAKVHELEYLGRHRESTLWTAEKSALCSSTEYGKDEDQNKEFLSKHTLLREAIVSYSEVIVELGTACEQAAVLPLANRAALTGHQAQLQAGYNELVKLQESRSEKLTDFAAFYEFDGRVRELIAWLCERTDSIESLDLGEDIRTTQRQLAKHGEIRQEVQGKAIVFDELSGAGPKHLENCRHGDFVSGTVDLQKCWASTNAALESRQRKLEEHVLFHKFADEVSETSVLIEEKSASLAARPIKAGESLSTIETMTRGHDRLTQDVITVAGKVEELSIAAIQLSVQIADYAPRIDKLKADVAASLAVLQASCAEKSEKLFELNGLQGFLAAQADLTAWYASVLEDVAAEAPGNDLRTVEAQLARHAERQAEIDARNQSHSSCLETGKRLMASDRYDIAQISAAIDELESHKTEALALSSAHEETLQKEAEVFLFLKNADETEAFAHQQEALLAALPVGASAEEILAHQRQYDDWCKSMAATREQLEAMQAPTRAEQAE